MNELITFIQQNIISYAFIIIFTLITINRVKTSFQVVVSLKIIKYIIIGYALLNIIWLTNYLFFDIENEENQIAFLKRASGVYFWTYLFMIVSSSLLPVMLLIKRVGNNKWILLIVSFLLASGSYFEKFVIITTGLYRGRVEWYYYINTFTIGVIITIILIGINIFHRKKNKDINP